MQLAKRWRRYRPKKVSKRSVRSNRLRTPKFADSGQKRARRGEPRRAREQRAHIGKKVAELSIEGSARSLLELRKQMPVNKDTGEIDYYRFLQSPVCSYIYAGIPAVRTKKEMPCKFEACRACFLLQFICYAFRHISCGSRKQLPRQQGIRP